VRGKGDLSAALLALYQGMDAPGTRVEQKHPISVQGKSGRQRGPTQTV
jgi:hypothetical protein